MLQSYEILRLQHRGHPPARHRPHRSSYGDGLYCIGVAYLVGEHKDINVKAIRILKHGKRAKSLIKYGMEEIANVLLRPLYKPKFDVFNFLSYLN